MMLDNVYTQQVTNIERGTDDKGHDSMVVTVQRKDRSVKQKKIGDWDLQKKFTVPGWYKLSYDPQTHFLTGVEFLGAEEAGNGSQPAVASSSPIASKSLKNVPGAFGAANTANALKDRQIAAAVILKATSEYLAAIAPRWHNDAADTVPGEMEKAAHRAFKVFQNLLEAYVENKQPEFETVEF